MARRITSENGNIFPCTECQAGHLQRQRVTYFTWLGDELITVPDFPAWVCDVCGRREYDAYAISQLNMLLNPNAGKSTLKHRRLHPKSPTRKNTRQPRP